MLAEKKAKAEEHGSQKDPEFVPEASDVDSDASTVDEMMGANITESQAQSKPNDSPAQLGEDSPAATPSPSLPSATLSPEVSDFFAVGFGLKKFSNIC